MGCPRTLGKHLEQRVLERPYIFRVEPLGERSEAGKVGEENRDLTAISFGGRAVGRLVSSGGRHFDAVSSFAAPTLPTVPRLPWLRVPPQRGQNAKSGSHANPHEEQGLGSPRPQRGQNAKPGEASKPQAEQIICPASLNHEFHQTPTLPGGSFSTFRPMSTSTSISRSQAPVEPPCWEQSISATAFARAVETGRRGRPLSRVRGAVAAHKSRLPSDAGELRSDGYRGGQDSEPVQRRFESAPKLQGIEALV